MQLVILAGGKGTRLGLADIPKPMVSMAGKPLLEHQIELAKKYGINEVFILSGHLAHVIDDYFGDDSKYGIKIHLITEPAPLGTAGALKLLKGKLKERFLVFYGDIVMDFDISKFQEFDASHNGIASLVVHPNNHPYDSDLIDINQDNQIQRFLSKPHSPDLYYRNLTNAAVYIFSPKIMDYIPDDKPSDFGKNIFPELLKHNEKIYAYSTAEYIRDMGTKDRFPIICDDLENGRVARLNKKNKRPAIFMDRDGTINENMDTNPTLNRFKLLPGVANAIRTINNSVFLSIVVTNQPMIAKGFCSFSEIDNIHKKMETLLGAEHAYLNGIYYCPHHPDKGFHGERPELKIVCECRKPNIGMFISAQHDFNIDLSKSWMVGDSESDMLAGARAGCKTILINNKTASIKSDYKCADLFQAVALIMENTK